MNAFTDPAVPDHSEKCFHCRLGPISPLFPLSPPFPQSDAATVCLTARLTTPSRLQVQLQAAQPTFHRRQSSQVFLVPCDIMKPTLISLLLMCAVLAAKPVLADFYVYRMWQTTSDHHDGTGDFRVECAFNHTSLRHLRHRVPRSVGCFANFIKTLSSPDRLPATT